MILKLKIISFEHCRQDQCHFACKAESDFMVQTPGIWKVKSKLTTLESGGGKHRSNRYSSHPAHTHIQLTLHVSTNSLVREDGDHQTKLPVRSQIRCEGWHPLLWREQYPLPCWFRCRQVNNLFSTSFMNILKIKIKKFVSYSMLIVN